MADAGDRSDQAIKAAQAGNFDALNRLVAGTPFDRHLRFLNFGYQVLDGEQPQGPKLGFAFPNKDSAQLLFQVMADTPIDGRVVADVGCGRGGNLWLLRRHHAPAATVGIDIASGSVRHAADAAPAEGSCWAVGDAEQLPLRDQSVDVVLNVETGATYPHIERFFREAVRVLRPGGHLLYADIVHAQVVDAHRRSLAALGMEELEARDISANVVAARDERSRRQALAFAAAAEEDRSAVAEFAGESGSVLYEVFAHGDHRYVIFRHRRAAVVPAPEAPLLTDEEAALAHETSLIAVRTLSLSGADRTDPPPA
ncbi:MAG: class I SAM-dependent methyltransferase [Acidimicrobiales bacterium]